MIWLVGVVTAIIFLPVLNASFLNWDDSHHIVNNPALNALDVHHVQAMFTQTVQLVYIPLTSLSWAIERFFIGLNPGVNHAINVVGHIVNTWLLTRLAQRLGLKLWAIFVAAMVFAWHPMKVESVAWATERKDVVCALFYLMTLIAWIDYRRQSSLNNYGLALLGAILALLAKPMAISLPLVISLCDWLYVKETKMPLSTIHKGIGAIKPMRGVEVIPFVFVAGAIGWLTYQHHVRFPIVDMGKSFWVYVYTMAFYPIKFMMPVALNPIYTLPQPIAWFNPHYLLSFVVVVVIIGSVLLHRRNHWYVFAWGFYALSIFFLWRFDEGHDINIVADRFLYIPSIGACLALGVLAWHTRQYRYGWYALGFTLALLSALQVPVWHNAQTLFTHVLKLNPKNTIALNDRAESYTTIKSYDLAILDYQAILAIKPADADTLFNRGLAYQASQHHQQAIDDFNAVIKQYPQYDRVYLQRGVSWLALNHLADAKADFTRTIMLNPSYALAYLNRGLIKQREGDIDEAFNDFSQAIIYNNQLDKAYNNRAVIYAKRRAYRQAIEDLEQALKANPNNQEAAFNLKVIRQISTQISH